MSKARTSIKLTFDPQVLPFEDADRDSSNLLPAVPDAVLREAALRQRFGAPPIWTPELTEDSGFRYPGRDGTPTPAAVLLGLVMHEGEASILLTQRTAHLNDHAGQISFPGGRREDDDPTIRHTALRETHEEIGLAHSHIEVLGQLPDYFTGTGYQITPVVGLVTPPFELTPDAFEVADVFEVPLAFLMDPANHQRRTVTVAGGVTRTFYSMPWGSRFIWGATAAMLRNFYHFLRA